MFTDSTCPDSTCKYRNRLGYCTVTVCVAVSKPVAIREQTKTRTIEAVPLDKLCEWLAERYEPPYTLIDIDKLKAPIDFRQQKEIWLVALTKWMEEQDAAD